MNFRHLLEQHQLARQLFKTINRWLAEAGVMMTQGTLVDATIIEAPSSTKNKEQQRDPEMHQTKKGNQWHFGMKAHIGVDAKSGLTHSLVTTAPTSMTSISWVICFMERSNLSQPMPATRSATARGAGRGGCGLADRRASRQGKTLKQHPRKNKTAINIEYMKASIRAGGAPVSHHQAAVRLRESQIQGLLKTITNWRCYSPRQPVSGGPNDTSVGEISVKPEITPEMVEK